MKASIILDLRRETKNGYPIKIVVYKDKQHSIHLKEYSKSTHWNNGNVNKRHPEYRRLWRKLSKRALLLNEEVAYCNDNNLNLAECIKVIEKGFVSKESVNVFEFWDVFVEEKKTAGLSTKAYEDVKTQLFNYWMEDLPFNDITYEWLQGFINHKYENGCGNSGINFYLKTFGIVYREAQRRESLQVPVGNPFKGLRKKVVKKEMVKLSREKFKEILEWKPDKKNTPQNKLSLERRLAVWLFQFYIGGHDFNEVALLKWADIKRGRAKFSRHKNRNNTFILIDNLLLPEALAIIKKYGTKDDERVFGFIPDPLTRERSYNEYRNNTNRRLLKGISEELEINKLTTKSVRYIFRTWAGEVEAGIIPTMQIQGHSLLKEMTFLYQGRLSNEVLDRNLKKIVYGS